jgi:NADPH:quinone reductase-like Zn-dependent oxidoreductase
MLRLLEHMLIGPRMSKDGGKQFGMQGLATENQQDMLVIRELLETGKIVPVIDRTYPLSQTAEAIRHLETGHAQGKVIVTVVNGN